MKNQIIPILGLVFTGSLAWAEESKLVVTSFRYTGPETRTAELCGKVTGAASSPIYIRIVADHRTNQAGVYNTIAGADGRFCIVIASHTGRASAELWSQGTEPSTSLEAAPFKDGR